MNDIMESNPITFKVQKSISQEFLATGMIAHNILVVN